MTVVPEDALAHYGILRKSGRYPYGSGGPEIAGNKSFLDYVEVLRKGGMSEGDIAKGMGINTSQLRAAKSIARNEERQASINMALRLKDKGLSNVAIGKRMNVGESSVRALLEPGAKDRADVLSTTAKLLQDRVKEHKYIDVGSGVGNLLGISETKLATSVAALKEQGYNLFYLKVPQLGTGQNTTVKVLTAPDVTYSELSKNRGLVRQVQSFSQDGGRSYVAVQPPLSIDPKRVAIRYAKDGGTDADGVIYVRPDVSDVSLGGARYAQVRVAVGGTHYLKGMAMFKSDLPPGVDLMFNTNKNDTGNKFDAMKKMKTDDPENPFGAVVRQILDPKSGKVSSSMNVVNEEGAWDKWSKNLSSQLLSKQSPKLAKEQLAMTLERRKEEFDEIMKLTNPAVRKKLLETFADSADSASVHLKAAQLPRQKTSVILPINSLSPNEIYAPNFNNGERVALVRYPHGGIFEIPELIVNNNHPQAKKAMGTNAKDAVGINAKVAERLSGADFDGDTVLVIPNDSRKIKTAPALEGLKGFDPQRSYPSYEGMKPMTARVKAIEMGLVSNLITDMTIRGAPTDHLARAVRHSMVVIDAEKHNLNYKQSAKDNGITQLKTLYQGSAKAGASTLVSRAGSTIRVADRKGRSAKEGGGIDRITGKKVFTPTGETYTDKNGKLVLKTFESKRLAETNDAHTLSSGTPIEKVYADHSNQLKTLANRARLSALNTKTIPYSPAAKAAYADQVRTLQNKLDIAIRNRPFERQAQLLANMAYDAKKTANPDLEASDLKKLKGQELTRARILTGAGKKRIEITPFEWAAIQAGGITNSKLLDILNNADLDRVKELATPRVKSVMSSVAATRARTMLASGWTQAQVAKAVGVSLSTLKTMIEGE